MIVSVIGSGSKCIGYGKEIDSSDYVVRLVDCYWHNEKDHGTKYDIGIIRDVAYRKNRIEYAIEKNIFRLPKKEWWLYGNIAQNIIGVEVFDKNYFFHGLPVTKVDLDDLEIKTKLTTGTVAIVGAIKYLKPSKLMLYGFDDLASGIKTDYHKDSLHMLPPDYKPSSLKFGGGHVWENDWDLIKEVGATIELYHYGERI